MIAESNLTENITALIFYLAIAFFFFGLWVGWILWGSSGSRGSNSAWNSGHPIKETSIAPLLNPLAYSNLKISNESVAAVPQEVSAKPKEQDSKEINENSTTKSENSDLPAAWQGLNEDVSAGKARIDDSLGLIYSESPENEDDLTAIKGVGKVLNGKLNDFGIYTYRQIAGWNDSIVDEFSTRLSFKDRVKRDDWINQAKEFHKEKYGEDLA